MQANWGIWRPSPGSLRPLGRAVDSLKPPRGGKLYDVLAASPLIAAYGWVLVRDLPELAARFGLLRADGLEFGSAVGLLGHVLAIVVAALLIVLVFIRTVPIRKSKGLLPRAVALVGAAGGVTMLALPAAAIPLWLESLAVALILLGLAGMIVSFLWLKHAFSVLPEARVLVTTGPYAVIRHPVYLFEEITFFGMMLQFVQPWAFLIFAVQCAFQLARIPFEERVLREAFPEYEEYAARTSRLLPGIY